MYALFKLVLIVYSFTLMLYAGQSDEQTIKSHFFPVEVTSLPISDWQNPTADDYRILQRFIRSKVKGLVDLPISSRPFPNDFLNTEFYGWATYRLNIGNLVNDDDGDSTVPVPRVIHYNKDPNNKKKCIIVYVTCPTINYDRDYIQGVECVIKALEKTNYDGHLIYYIGGWPGLKKDRLKYVDSPYSFKPFLFEEAKDLGYENVLWVDACTIPVKNLCPLFTFLEEHGVCFLGGGKIQWNEFTSAYELIFPSLNTSYPYKDVITQIVGFNMKNPIAINLLNMWIENAEKKVPFIQSDQPPFGFLINQLNLLSCEIPCNWYVETNANTGDFSYEKTNQRALLYHQYDFLNPVHKNACEDFVERLHP